MRLEAINSYTSCNNLAKYKKTNSSKSSACVAPKEASAITFTSKPNSRAILSSFQQIKAQANNKAQYKLFKNKLIEYSGHSKDFVKHVLSKQEHDFERLSVIFDKFTERNIASNHFIACLETLQFNKDTEKNMVDYTPLEDLLNFRDKAVKNKHLLNIHGEETKESKVDEILFNRPLSTVETLNILGEKGFIYAFKDKEGNLDRYMAEFTYNYLSSASKESLIQLTNPIKSKKYNELKESIKEEKAKYDPSKQGTEKKELENKEVAIQPLLVPFILETNYIESNYINENINLISELGFEICDFGENSFKISTVPALLENVNIQEMFDKILSDIDNKLVLSKEQTIKEYIAKTACKTAVKGKNELSENEIKCLLGAFNSEEQVLLCPHGRPIIIEVSNKEIEKWFKRIV